jgi:hypothetical protein
MAEYTASKGAVGTALGLGIAGTAMSLFSGSFDRLLGRYLGSAGAGGAEPLVAQAQVSRFMEMELVAARAEKYADSKAFELERRLFEAQRETDAVKARVQADLEWVKSHYVQGQLVMPQSSVVNTAALTQAAQSAQS